MKKAALTKQKYLFLVIFSGILYMFLMYGNVLLHPNQYLTVGDGDGFKNYYSYLTEISESGEVNQQNFNYPYGESFFYTDSHPWLSLTLHHINRIFPGIEGYGVGILNIILLLNIFFTYLLLFLLLRLFVKHEWYAAIWAFAIMLLQPQIERLGGHQALSYSLAIPLAWYLIIRCYQTGKFVKYTIIIAVVNFFWLGTHAYLGLMTSGFTFLFDLYKLILNKQYKDYKAILAAFTRSLLPLLLFAAILSITDSHTGRTTNPYGFFIYYGSLSGVFCPYKGKLAVLLSKLPFTLDRTWEGIAYVGLAATVCMLFLLIKGIQYTWRRYIRRYPVQEFMPGDMTMLAPALFAAILFFLFSMGYPFKLKLQGLLDLFPFIKNFRGTGRFAWPFYYVALVTTAYVVYTYGFRLIKKRKMFAILLLIIAPFLTIIEAVPYQKDAYNHIFKTPNLFLDEKLEQPVKEALHLIPGNHYQALIPIPYYQGSENFSKYDMGSGSIMLSQLFSYHAKLPVMASFLARSSIPEAKNLMQMISPVYYDKAIKNDLSPGKPFLIVHKKCDQELQVGELQLLERATEIYDSEEFRILTIDYQTLFMKEYDNKVREFEQNKEHLVQVDGFWLSDSAEFVYLSFDEQETGYSRLGKGAFEKDKQAMYTEIMLIPPGKLPRGKYEISFWTYQCGENYGQDLLSWIFFVKNGPTELLAFNGRETLDIDGCWSLYKKVFEIEDEEQPHQLSVSRLSVEKSFYIDELLIRPVEIDVYRDSGLPDQWLYKNGDLIHP